ncbi:SDR family oxidoreductase [Pseudonocardia alaniniphila]|uniref:SDR family oxidoreductase n=1 Tax=Pseudonocardia alaniniphila TaxID=75291 RepID=A0ABS9TA20_9PSEU|nr:SDR family oxidoreductase [Pseudonocardia alaniniphila]MCH6165379.1 SDR family oxidoreductase [Pseudonocardia alaniniphila]
MDIQNSVAVVTGANRGLGRHFAAELVKRGAKVYAGARNPSSIDLPDVVPLQIDITDPESVAAAAATASDATLLINNVGIDTHTELLDGDLDDIRQELETHLFGTLRATRAFVPVIEANGGGGVLNVLSVLSWVHIPQSEAYSVGKAASWAMTNSVRTRLAPKGIRVTALHAGYLDTDMAAHIDGPKNDPAVVAALALDGVQEGAYEVLADEISKNVRAGLSADLTALYPQLTAPQA